MQNCISAKCCATSGMKCFRKDAGFAQCKKKCPGGGWSFMQNCMDKHGVGKRDGFDSTLSGTCPESRPKAQKKNASYVPPCPSSYSGPAIHPFRTPETYFTCLGALTGKNYA